MANDPGPVFGQVTPQPEHTERETRGFGKANNPLTLAILAVIFGVLLPPLGLILAITTIYRAGQQSRKSLLILGITAVLATAAGLYGYLYLYNNYTNNRTYAYAYNDLVDYKVAVAEGVGITFKLPSELLPSNIEQQVDTGNLPRELQLKGGDPTRQANTGQISFTHPLTPRGSLPLILARQSVFISGINNLDFDKVMTAANGPEYDQFITGLQRLLQTQTETSNAKLTGVPKAFTNTNIKASAWTIDFSAEGANPLSTNTKQKKMRGSLLIAKGNKGAYYQISFAALDYNWPANQKIWQQILDSVRVDQ